MARLGKNSRHMSMLIDDLLGLFHVTRKEMRCGVVDLSAIARAIADELRLSEPDRPVDVRIADGLTETGDAGLLKAALANLFGNAWKFTSRNPEARIDFGVFRREGTPVYFVEDNGAGFDMAYSGKLFAPFQRLHDADEFEGTGIGLATVQRIVHRHGGRVWAEGVVGKGATFYFTLTHDD